MPLDFKNTKRVGLLAKLGRGRYNPALAAQVRPAEPRIERAQYLKWVRSVFVLWRHFVADQIKVGRIDADAKKPVYQILSNGEWSGHTARSEKAAIDRVRQWNKNPELSQGGQYVYTYRLAPTATTAVEAPVSARLLSADWDELIDRSGLPGLLDRIAKSIADRNQNYFAKIVRTTPPKIGAEADMIRQFTERNIGLIKNAGHESIDQINAVLADANAKGLRHEQIADLISERVDVSESRAKLIARDQTLKYNSAVHTAQATAAGVEEFTWSTSHDSAVRPDHRELDGKRFRYDDPPVTNDDGDTNLPGEDYQCRCVAIPVIELFAGIDDED